jgi:hypothetical protein
MAQGEVDVKRRERVLQALNHEEPDRCPMQISFTPEFAARLRADIRLQGQGHNPHGGGNTYVLERALDQDMLLTSVGWANSYYARETYGDRFTIGRLANTSFWRSVARTPDVCYHRSQIETCFSPLFATATQIRAVCSTKRRQTTTGKGKTYRDSPVHQREFAVDDSVDYARENNQHRTG